MSSMLRYAKHLRRLNGVEWRVVLNQPQIEMTGMKLGCYQTQSVYLNLNKSYATNLATKKPFSQYQPKETGIQALDARVKRFRRVSKSEIQKAVTEIQFSGIMSSLDALFLIRCCGRLFIESSNEESIQLVQEIWDTCTRLNVPLDVSHYNALLNVYLDKDHRFSPSSFISTMLDKSIEPNRVTYQRLIMAYCKQGDITGATKILEIMKDKNIPLCENIFNSLIIGHSEAGDLQSATEMLETMKKTGITPSSDTYNALMCANAKHGNIKSIETILEELKKSDQFYINSSILEVFDTFIVNGHIEIAEKFLEKYLVEIEDDSEVSRILIKLVNLQHIPLAMKLLETSSTDPLRRAVRSAYIIRALNRNQSITTNDIIKICKNFQDNGLNDRAFQTAIFHGFKSNSAPSTLISLLKAWRENGGEIRIHYFWPLLRSYTKQNSYEGMISIISTMINDFGLIPCVETLQDYVIPYMFGTWQDAISVLENLNIPKENIYFAILNRLLMEKKLRNAGLFMTGFPIKYPKEVFLNPLVEAFMTRNSVETFVDALRLLDRDPVASNCDTTQKELIDTVVLKIISVLPIYQFKVLVKLLEEFVKYGLIMSPNVGEKVKSYLGDKITPEINEVIEKLTSEISKEIPISESNPYRHIKKSENTTMDPQQLRNMFNNYLKMENASGILNVLKIMNELNYFSPSIFAQALSHFCDCGNFEAAEKCFIKIKNENVKLDNLKYIKYATLLLKNNHVDSAFTLVSNLPDANSVSKYSRTFRTHIRELFDVFVKEKDAENLSKMFHILYSKNFIDPDGFMLGPLIQIHLTNDNLELALETLEDIFNKYRCLPMKNLLIKKFIEREDANSLQKITDLSTEVHGEANALIDLAFSFLECDRPRQARKILETSGIQIHDERMSILIKRLYEKKDMKSLEKLPQIVRGMSRINHSHVFDCLLNIYDKENDWKRGLELWTEMQETDSYPSPQFLPKLRKLLERNDQTVPFVYTETNVIKNLERATSKIFSKTSIAISQVNKELEEALSKEDYKLAEKVITTEKVPYTEKLKMYYEIINRAVSNNNIDTAIDLVRTVLEKHSHINRQVLSKVAKIIKDEDNLKKFEALSELMDDQIKENVTFKKLLSLVRIQVHGLKKYLENLDLTVPRSIPRSIENTIHFGAIVKGLRDDPNLLPLVEEIAFKLQKENVPRLMDALWNYYLINGSPKAKNLWDQYVSKSNSPLIQPIIAHATEKQDPQLIEQVIALTENQNNISLNIKAKLATALMNIYNATENYEASLKTFQQASRKFRSVMLSINALKDLKAGLEKFHKRTLLDEAGKKLEETMEEKLKQMDSNAAKS